MSVGKYISIASISMFFGFIGGLELAEYTRSPSIAYGKKVSGDEREFLIVESKSGFKTPMVRTPHTPYITLKEAEENVKEVSREKFIKEIISSQKTTKSLEEELLK